MKTTTILTILLMSSVTYNIYQYSTKESAPAATDCFKTNGYAGAIEISNDEARAYYNEFDSKMNGTEKTTGGVISRAAFDTLLCLEKCNGIAYSFARDSSGTNGPENSGIFIIFQGVNIEYDSTRDTITAVNPIDGALKYRSGNWCPLTCMSL